MPEQSEKDYDSLLRKYIAVWLWSILFGSMSGVGYTFIGYRPFEGRFRAAVLLSALFFAFGSLAALACLISLYRALVRFLIPQFVLGSEGDPQEFASLLRNAFVMFMFAVITRVLVALVEVVLTGFTS